MDDRRVIGGIVHVLKSGCRWCDVPPEYGPPTTIYNRFMRWAERGVWENLFNGLAALGTSTDTQTIDSTHIKAHGSASGEQGGERTRAVGLSRGRRNAKIHAITDAKSCFVTFVPTEGEAHDCPIGMERIAAAEQAELLVASNGYDSADPRQHAKDREPEPIMPSGRNQKKRFHLHRKQYCKRHTIADTFCSFRDFRRVATRSDKMDLVFPAFVDLTVTVASWAS